MCFVLRVRVSTVQVTATAQFQDNEESLLVQDRFEDSFNVGGGPNP